MYFHLIFSPTQNLAHLLYKAAKECSYVNPHKIMEILEVPLLTSSGSQAVDGKSRTLSIISQNRVAWGELMNGGT